jgi:pimeloyl-ACP methyl ester carboxylesterase
LNISNSAIDRLATIDKQYLPATMHVYGTADPIVPYEDSKDMASYFPDPVLYEHDGKHFLPVTSPAKQMYTNFVDKCKM